MKTIGLIGGLSWESTACYYRYINIGIKTRLGGLRSAKCLLYSFDFSEVVQLQEAGKWQEAAALLAEAAVKLEASGCDVVLICTNTMHTVAEDVQRAVSIPLLHIIDVTANEVKRQSIHKVGLLGTQYTMEQPFYRERLQELGIEAIVPEKADRDRVHEIIFHELCRGELNPSSKAEYLQIIERLRAQGAEGIILGCTEIPLLLQEGDGPLPLFDTTYLHARAAVEFALNAPIT
ncbi:aspartate/glutamate racemase family protein [Paenibacillus hemerocallicola]|uniref:Aspartate/glutamate racemase family protein n=1 Tax=Paenibacillus hemerocallicola TaxID=1172614 RepID=A0A5C4TG83_9BACL|nr:aspartate/glutamate racemase family protein [Paenibacillus hemerocallicola]TNJ68103.1 aspartate/glutamate racemase family protein [Paenibacillus hemerocallicola]